MDIKNMSTMEIMNLYSSILTELKDRRVIRTFNSPVGDYAEWLVAKTLKLELLPNSQKGYDAIDKTNGIRYQIKCRWERGTPSMQSRELSVIRKYDQNQFDQLIVIVFGAEFDVKEAYMMPHSTVEKYGRKSAHVNGMTLIMQGAVLRDPETMNITDHFINIMASNY